MSSEGSTNIQQALNEKIVTLATPLTNGPPVRSEMELTAVGGLADVGQFRELADMLFLPSQVLQPHERAYLIDMIKVALPALARQERLLFAQRLAKMGDSGKPLLSVLSRDGDLEVASAILSSSIPLADDVLVELTQSAEPERLLLIARRADLSTSVTAAILFSEDVPAIHECLKNSKARFSPQVLAECVPLAEEYPLLRTPLMQREEITPAVALDLFWMMEHKGRVDILLRHLADDQYLNKTSLAKSSSALHQRDQVTQTIVSGASDLEQLGACISIGEIERAIPLLVRVAGLRDVLARQILSDPGGEPLAVLYKHAGARRSQFQNLCERIDHLGLSPLAKSANFEAISILFDRLSRGQAHMAITYWDWRAASIGPYEKQRGEAAFYGSERSYLKPKSNKPELHIHEVKPDEPSKETENRASFGKRSQYIPENDTKQELLEEHRVETQNEHADFEENMTDDDVYLSDVRSEKSVTIDDETTQDQNAQTPQETEDQYEAPAVSEVDDDLGSQVEDNNFQEAEIEIIIQDKDDDFEFRPKKQINPAAQEKVAEPILDLRKMPRLGSSRGYLTEID